MQVQTGRHTHTMTLNANVIVEYFDNTDLEAYAGRNHVTQ